ncbi:glycerophosphodiester phosphodiesterase [Actinotalea sp. C106]|uniref:glycerophosphodiester phosphodiesterase n=1 Tax=Actinotalea sp. C106 TaxID=2908644 RepID=UPI002027E2D0|nr:glycerophosphodiester phosphodiesterase [Actinotalea sp. C106]
MSWYDPSAPPLAISHRGDHRHHVENTLPAIEAAMLGGADMVEIDVQLAADGAVVVHHDATFSRLWDDPRPVAAVDTAAVRSLGADDRRVPLLVEALELSRSTGVPLVIDQKTPEVAAAAALLVQGIGMSEQTGFCGELGGLWQVRHTTPGARIFYNALGLAPPDVRVLGLLRPELYNPEHSTLAPILVDALHGLGIGVSCWTPNARHDIERLLGMGLDAIMSDDLPLLRSVVDGTDWRAARDTARGPAQTRTADDAAPATGSLVEA